MRQYLAAATALFALTAATSPCVALQVTMSSPKSSFVQGEPIYVWVDYYNDTKDEIGLPAGYLFGFYVLTVRTQDGELVTRPMEQIKRPPIGRNQIQRIGPEEHFVFFADLLEHVNLTDPGNYVVQIVAPNPAPERYLDEEHPVLPRSKLVRGPIESNRWQFTIARGSGGAFDLVAKPLKEKTAGTFALCPNAAAIVEKYGNSPYGPYAVMCEVDRLLSGGEQGPELLKDRLASAQALVDGLRSDHAGFEYLDIALIRHAERLVKVGQNEAASKLLRELQLEERTDAGKLYVGRLLSTRTVTK